MNVQAWIGQCIEAMGLPPPVSDPVTLAAELMSQLALIQSLNRLDLDDESSSPSFDVRWDR